MTTLTGRHWRFQIIYDQSKDDAANGDPYPHFHIGSMGEVEALAGYVDGLRDDRARRQFVAQERTWVEREKGKIGRAQTQAARSRACSLSRHLQRLENIERATAQGRLETWPDMPIRW